MEVWVGDTAVFFVRLVDGKVCNHATGDEVVQQELPREGDVFLSRELVLQRDVEAVGELRVFVALHILDRVPKCLPVGVLARRVRREQDFRVHHAAFARVVAELPVILTVELFSCSVSRGLDRRLPRAALDLSDVEVKERQSLTSLRQYGLYLWQVEYALGQFIKLALAHVLDRRRDAFHRRTARYEPVVAFLSFADLKVLGTALDSLHLMR